MRISITSSNSAEVNGVYHWLRGSGDGGLEVTGRSTDDTTMGWDIVGVVLTHAVAIGNFALAIATYRRARPRSQPLTITRSDGRTMTVDGPPELVELAIVTFLTDDSAADPR